MHLFLSVFFLHQKPKSGHKKILDRHWQVSIIIRILLFSNAVSFACWLNKPFAEVLKSLNSLLKLVCDNEAFHVCRCCLSFVFRMKAVDLAKLQTSGNLFHTILISVA